MEERVNSWWKPSKRRRLVNGEFRRCIFLAGEQPSSPTVTPDEEFFRVDGACSPATATRV